MDFAKLLIAADSRQVKTATSDLHGLVKESVSADTVTNKLAGTIKGALGIALAGLTFHAVAGQINELSSAASDLFETVSKTQVIFGDSSKSITSWADTTSDAIGQSKRQALDAAGTFAIFGSSAGVAGDDLVDFSKKFTVLASDLASFYNTSPEDAITAIGAAMRGENEPIRRYGVMLDDVTLKQEALRMGIISTTKNALTPQQKILAASEQLFKQTSVAQGDFARTADGLANTQRTYNATIEDMRAKLGEDIMPLMKEWYSLLIKISNVAVNPLSDLIKGLSMEMRLLRGESIESMKTTETLSAAMKKGGEDGAGMLLDRIGQLSGKLSDAKKDLEEMEKPLSIIRQLFSFDPNESGLFKEGRIKDTKKEIEELTKQIDNLYGALNGVRTGTQGGKPPKPPEPTITPYTESDQLKQFLSDQEKLYSEKQRLLESVMTPEQQLIELEKQLNNVYLQTDLTLYERNDILAKTQEEYLNTLNPLEAYVEAERLYNEQLAANIITQDQYTAKLANRRVILDEATKKEAKIVLAATQSEIDSLYSGLLTQEEMIINSYEKRRQAILDSTVLTEQERSDLMIRSEIELNNNLAEIRTKNNADIAGGFSKLFSTIGGLGKTFAGEQSALYKTMFNVSKAFELAEALLQLNGALAKAGNSAPWPYNLPAIAGAAATMGGIVADLVAVNFAGAKDKGGYIPSNSVGIMSEYGDELKNGVLVRGPATITSREDTAKLMQPKMNVRVVNVIDPNLLSDYIGSEAGEELVMNVIRKNRDEIGF